MRAIKKKYSNGKGYWVSPLALVCLLALALTGCGGGYYWKEEAAQPSGGSFEVERVHKLGTRWDQEISAWSGPPPVVGYTVWVPLPSGGRARWDGDRDLIPIAAVVQGGVAYLATSPWNCGAYVRSGAILPPYVFFRFEAGQWRRISVDEFPANVEHANLLIAQGPAAREAIETGFVSAEGIRKLNRYVDIDRSTINRKGPWLVWLACFESIERGNYRNTK